MGIQINGQTHTVTPIGGDTLHVGGDLIVPGLLSYDDVTSIDSVGLITARAGVHVTGGSVGIGTDNPGAKLDVYNGNISLYAPTHEQSLRLRTDRGTIAELVHLSGDGALRLYTGEVTPTLRTYISSYGNTYFNPNAGNVGIGTDNPPNLLTLGASGGPTMRLADTTGGAFSIITGGSNGDLTFSADHGDVGSSTNIIFSSDGNQERLRIASDGTIHINSADSASGGRIYAASSKLYLQSGNGRQSFNIADMAAGSTATHEFNSSGNLVLAGGMQAASVNLQSSTTNSWFQTGANYGGTDYVWAAKDSSANVWHSGLQTDGDLFLGGNITGTPNIKLNGSNGSGFFTGQLDADPVHLNANYSWIHSTYGAISNSTVSSLNNLLIGQNMRGWIGTRDGGSANNNFYSLFTFGAGTLGHAGTEYCYNGLTKFYNDTDASTANTAFTPKERFRISNGGSTVGGAYNFSTNSSTNNELPNPYNIGNVNANNVAYPHTPGIYFVTASSPCDNTWRTLFTSINDSNWIIEGTSGDASSKRKYKIIGNPTSPSYGVNLVTEDYHTGGWNTGDIEFRLDGTHPNWNLQVKTTSYYNSSNLSGIKFMLFVIY